MTFLIFSIAAYALRYPIFADGVVAGGPKSSDLRADTWQIGWVARVFYLSGAGAHRDLFLNVHQLTNFRELPPRTFGAKLLNNFAGEAHFEGWLIPSVAVETDLSLGTPAYAVEAVGGLDDPIDRREHTITSVFNDNLLRMRLKTEFD